VDSHPSQSDSVPEYLNNFANQTADNLSDQLPDFLKERLKDLGKRTVDKEKLDAVILALCSWRPLTIKQLAGIMRRNEKYLLTFITPLREKGKLIFTIPEMHSHPNQAYKTVTT
jgi:hypothetical protein